MKRQIVIYETRSYHFDINPIPITRETDFYFFYKDGNIERRFAKCLDTHRTYEQARNHIITREMAGLRSAENRLETAKRDLARAEAIPEKEPGT